MLLIMPVTLNSFLKNEGGALETGKRQDYFVVQRVFSESDTQVRENGDESREPGF